MTFPLGSLQSDAPAAPRPSGRGEAPPGGRVGSRLSRPAVPEPVDVPVAPEHTLRFQMALLFGGVVWLLTLLALVSHHRLDAAFTTSGQHQEVRNWVGALGAHASDLAYLLFGLSAWWLLVIGARAWLGALARWLRRDDALASAGSEPAVPAWRVWLGLVMLMSASCSLEWSRLYKQEAALAGEHAGGG
ncbi:DNA translocase FtsK 4TM domain-containing protein, partial [Aquabacterium sp. UBA2148]|uniref:DNA translocase FtsK 4TM domain-containing protein n=1 Tax=Aquabacterium sp. UBA2148 TaxID=1946042 RepID=UPI002580FE50